LKLQRRRFFAYENSLGKSAKIFVISSSERSREIECHHAGAFFVGDFLVIADTEEDILDGGVFPLDVVHVGGGDDRDAGFAADLDQPWLAIS